MAYALHNTAVDARHALGFDGSDPRTAAALYVLEAKHPDGTRTIVRLRDEEVDTLFGTGGPFPEDAQIEALLATLPPERFCTL